MEVLVEELVVIPKYNIFNPLPKKFFHSKTSSPFSRYLHLHINPIPFPSNHRPLSPKKRGKELQNSETDLKKNPPSPSQKLLEHRPRTRELKAILSQDPLNTPLSLLP